MTPNISSQELLLPAPVLQEVAVSVVLPFEPRTQPKKQIEAAQKRLLDAVEQQLLPTATRQVTRQISSRLKQMFEELDYSATARSAVFWVSAEKSIKAYWQLPMNEAVELAPAFDARRLLAHRAEEKQYLLLVLANHFAGIYLGNGRQLSRLVANAPVSAAAHSAATHPALQKQEVLERTVRHFDNALTILVRAYRLPVFIVAPASYLDVFRSGSANAQAATALIEVPASLNETGLQQTMAPYLLKWQTLTEKRLLAQLEGAGAAGKLATGISAVWTAAVQKRGRILLAEEDYVYPAYIDPQGALLYADAIPMSQTSRQTADAVSDAMQHVLASGGRVELVSKNALADYGHTAMILY